MIILVTMEQDMYTRPLAYFITFTTYGTWLHGDPRNSVIRRAGISLPLGHEPSLNAWENQKLKHPVVVLDADKRQVVLKAIIEHCAIKNWALAAVHVRSNHIHTIVSANDRIQIVCTGLKSWATRALRRAGYNMPRMWTKGASCRYIFTQAMLQKRLRYVMEEQGQAMQRYYDAKAMQYIETNHNKSVRAEARR